MKFIKLFALCVLSILFFFMVTGCEEELGGSRECTETCSLQGTPWTCENTNGCFNTAAVCSSSRFCD